MNSKHSNNTKALIFGFILFFLTIGVTSVGAIVVYQVAINNTHNMAVIILSVIGIIAVGALFCSSIDVIRRKIMVESPVNKILDATQKIASGNFNIKLHPEHEYLKYDKYDLIFENINTMTAELSKNEMLKDNFISNVSHEIKTPLTVIQNLAKTLQNDKLSKEKKDECLNSIILQIQKLSNLISNILQLSKLENNQLMPEMKEFDLAECLRVSTLAHEQLFEKKNLNIVVNIEECKIINAESLIELAFNNLLSNAIKFTDNGGKITVSLKTLANHVVISVKDTGCGISSDVGKHIFDKFYQADTSRAVEGNGLGLALVKKVIDLVGGEIFVESTPNKGSIFTIKLKKEQ